MDRTALVATAAERIKELQEFVGLLAAYYDADSARRGGTGKMAARRQAQIIALTEVNRILDGRKEVLDWLRERDLVPLDWRELEEIATGKLLDDPT